MKMKTGIFSIIVFAFVNVAFAQSSLVNGNGAEPRLVVQEGNNGSVKYLKYTANGKYILSTDDNNAKIWDVESGRLIRTIRIRKDTGDEKTADISSDGTFCVYVSPKGKIEICDIKTGNITSLYYEYSDIDLALSPDDKFVAILTYFEACIYDVKSLKRLITVKNDNVVHYKHAAFSADSKKLGFVSAIVDVDVGYGRYFLLDISSHKLSPIIRIGNSPNLFTLSPDGKYLASVDYDGNIVITNVRTKKIVREIARKNLTYDIKFSPDGNKIFILRENDEIEIYDTKTGEKSLCTKYGTPGIIAFSADGKYCCVPDYNRLKIYDRITGELQKTISGASAIKFVNFFKNKNMFCFSCMGRHFVFNENFEFVSSDECFNPFATITDSGVLYIDYTKAEDVSAYVHPFSGEDDYKIFDLPELHGSVFEVFKNSSKKLCAVRKDNRVYIYRDSSYLGYYETEERFYDDIVSPARRFVFSDDYVREKSCIVDIVNNMVVKTENYFITFSPDDRYIAYKTQNKNEAGSIYVCDTNAWQESAGFWKRIKRFDGYGHPCFSHTGKYFVTGADDKGIHIYDFASGKKIRTVTIEEGRLDCSYFTADDSKFVYLTYGDIIRVLSTDTWEIIASVVADENGDWLTYTPEGYFNGSEGAIKKFVHLVNGMEVTGLDQLAESLYRPDLVAAKLRGEDISAQENAVSLTELVSSGNAPAVSFVNPPATASKRDITVNFTVQDAGGGVGSVYLKLNDKVIQLADGSRKFELVGGETTASPQPNGKRTDFSHLLTLQNGENTIEAYATNAAGKIESRHAVAKISWNGSTAKPNLYVLSVGVNKYRDRSLWLNYAVPDAVSIAESFKSAKGNLYQSVNVETVFDGDVTKESLTAKFKELSPKVCADDVFVLFISGHGTISNKTGDYYFIPSNFRYTDSDALFAQGISKNDILGYMSGIQAQKSLIMLDTCNSGAFTNDSAARGFAEKSALERLVHATGQAVLTAASEEQSAMEGYEGHGIFTYVLLDALSGKADRNKDGYITLNELASYIEELVPELSYQKWGYEQVPMKDLRKQDFPLVGN